MFQSHYAETRHSAADSVPFAHVLAPQSYAGEGVYLVIAAVVRCVGKVCRRVQRMIVGRLIPVSD